LVDDLSPTLGYAKDGAPVLFCLEMKNVSSAKNPDGDGFVDAARTFWIIYRFPAHF
jgi:nitrous oxide reductase accessory protein NosL